MERHQRDLPGAHHNISRKTTAAKGTKATARRSKPGPGPVAEDEPPGREDQDGGEGRAEEEVPGMEARQRERVDKGEGRNRRDVTYHPEPPVKAAADCSLR